MTPVGMAVSLIALLGSLFLAIRAWRADGASFANTGWMAAVWALIISGVAFLAPYLLG